MTDECCEPMSEACAEIAKTAEQKPITVMERLTSRERELQKALAETRRAKELLEKNPDLAELLSILARSGSGISIRC